MKLLIFTQAVDLDNPVLSFFHAWIKALAGRVEKVSVICLYEGRHDLPANVKVFSLGKEKGNSKLTYIKLFYRYIFAFRKDYDAVFVHMNQEYILLGSLLWKIWGKRIYMWRNHHAGTALTALACTMCDNVFCTSRYSYTAKFKNKVLMPVGVDTELFKPYAGSQKIPRSVLFLGRIAPVKRPDLLIAALTSLRNAGKSFIAHIYGNPLPQDISYRDSLMQTVKRENLESAISFLPGIPNVQTPEIFSIHKVNVNLSTSGMYDKTIFEAMACETLVLASNRNLEGEIPDICVFAEGDKAELASKLTYLLDLEDSNAAAIAKDLRKYVIEHHSFTKLIDKVIECIS